MALKLFNKSIVKRCEYCRYATKYPGSDTLFCKYRGVVEASDKCRKYRYDILKRQPVKQSISDDYSKEDFVL